MVNNVEFSTSDLLCTHTGYVAKEKLSNEQ